MSEILTTETRITRGGQTLIWIEGSTAERGICTGKGLLNTKETDMRGTVIIQENEMRGKVFF